MFGKKKIAPAPDSFVVQIPAHYTKGGVFTRGKKVEKIVAEWDKKGYRLHSMTPLASTNPWIRGLVTHYALNFHRVSPNG